MGLEPRVEPITGSVTDAHGRRRTFCGWLDLMEILDTARRDHELEPADEAPHPPGGTK